MKQKKLLVIGGYGIGNIGDEAMLSVIADRFSNYKITALTYSIKETEIIHNLQGISMGGALLTFPFYDKILIGGGTIFRGGLRRRVKLLPFLLYLIQIILR
ncbi:hypothetical protein HZB88_05265, partial [archaeon]|nr:hypothetical protein [archaeon]